MACRSILALPAAGVGSFFSAWKLMIGLGWVNEDPGIKDFGYVTSMYVTLVLRVVMGPAIAVIARAQMNPLIMRPRSVRIIDVN